MRTEELMLIVASNHGQSLEEVVEEIGVSPAQVEGLVKYILAACGQA